MVQFGSDIHKCMGPFYMWNPIKYAFVFSMTYKNHNPCCQFIFWDVGVCIYVFEYTDLPTDG